MILPDHVPANLIHRVTSLKGKQILDERATTLWKAVIFTSRRSSEKTVEELEKATNH